jgi:hypothetical protein
VAEEAAEDSATGEDGGDGQQRPKPQRSTTASHRRLTVAATGGDENSAAGIRTVTGLLCPLLPDRAGKWPERPGSTREKRLRIDWGTI